MYIKTKKHHLHDKALTILQVLYIKGVYYASNALKYDYVLIFFCWLLNLLVVYNRLLVHVGLLSFRNLLTPMAMYFEILCAQSNSVNIFSYYYNVIISFYEAMVGQSPSPMPSTAFCMQIQLQVATQQWKNTAVII